MQNDPSVPSQGVNSLHIVQSATLKWIGVVILTAAGSGLGFWLGNYLTTTAPGIKTDRRLDRVAQTLENVTNNLSKSIQQNSDRIDRKMSATLANEKWERQSDRMDAIDGRIVRLRVEVRELDNRVNEYLFGGTNTLWRLPPPWEGARPAPSLVRAHALGLSTSATLSLEDSGQPMYSVSSGIGTTGPGS